MFFFLGHRLRERGYRVVPPIQHGVVDHTGIGPRVLPGLAGNDAAQVICGTFHRAGNGQVAHAVRSFGSGYLFENLRNFRVSLLPGFLRIGGVGEMRDCFGDDGLPEIAVGR